MLKESQLSDPAKLLAYLEKLEKKITTRKVERYFANQPPRILNEYLVLSGDLKLLVAKLRVKQLKKITDRINVHTKELVDRSAELDTELKSLSSARKTLSRLNKIVSVVSRIALPFL